jgi:hypothetical protein
MYFRTLANKANCSYAFMPYQKESILKGVATTHWKNLGNLEKASRD